MECDPIINLHNPLFIPIDKSVILPKMQAINNFFENNLDKGGKMEYTFNG